jgi:hypothetical protein
VQSLHPSPQSSPDHLTRFDLGQNESSGEAFYQFVFQAVFYFMTVGFELRTSQEGLKFTSLAFSMVFSLFSLSMAQYKVVLI